MNCNILEALAILISLAIASGAMLVFLVVVAQVVGLASAIIGWPWQRDSQVT